MIKRRVSAQPDSPVLVRMRLQSSVGNGFRETAASSFFGAASSDNSSSSSRLVFESSSQLAGGPGGLGGVIGGYLDSLGGFFSSSLTFLGAGGISGLCDNSARGVLTCMSTSILSFSLIWRKLGDWRAGCVCTLSSPKLVACPCTGIC